MPVQCPPFLILGPPCDLRSPQSLPLLKPFRTSHPKSGAQLLSPWAGAPSGKSWVSRASPPAGPRPSIPAASTLRGLNRPREGAAARGTPTQPGASYLGRQSESPGGHSRPAPSPGGDAALPAVRAVWPRSGPLLLALKLYKLLIIKKARKKKRKPSFPNSQINFSRGWGRRICLEGDPNFCERPAGRLAWPGRPGQRSGPGAALGTSWGRGEPSRRVGGAATALFDVEPPAHPGAGIRGAPMSSNVRKFEEG